jgi:hypothetical protein
MVPCSFSRGTMERGVCATRTSASVFPKRTREPGASGASRTRVSSTQVPLRLSRSTSQSCSPRRSNMACMLEIQGSAICTWHSGERPTAVGTSGRKNTVPWQIPFMTNSSVTWRSPQTPRRFQGLC